MPPFTFTPRNYLHFDQPVSAAVAEKLATNPEAVARHPFYPFIHYSIVTRKIRRKKRGGVELTKPKERVIAFAAHKDSHIFAHYSRILEELYEQALQQRNLHHCITAFRSLDRKRNIHFANEVFEFIRSRKTMCAVLALDISDFFGSIHHLQLKAAWRSLLGVDRLPDDHHAVFGAITRYAQVERTALCKAVGIDPDRPRANHQARYCSPLRFRELVRGNGLCSVNRSGRGIPQGSPISALLSNLYLLDFDTEVAAWVTKYGGIYRRYCDDILVAVPIPFLRAKIFAFIQQSLQELGLPVHPQKTEAIDFVRIKGRLRTKKPLNYLGFTFDGEHKRLRPASIARFYKKMRRGVLRARAVRARCLKHKNRDDWTPLRRRKLHILYSYLGRHNFLSYAFDAARIMGDSGIKKQVKAHWKRLQNLIQQSK